MHINIPLCFIGCVFVCHASALDMQPPDVPNPWNTSESKAIRDHLTETFRVQAPANANDEQLRALYKKTWLADQEDRFINGGEVDPRFLAAKKLEAEAIRRDSLIAGLERLGIHPDHSLTTDALNELLDKTKAEQVQRQVTTMPAATPEPQSEDRRTISSQTDHSIALQLRPVTNSDKMPDEDSFAKNLSFGLSLGKSTASSLRAATSAAQRLARERTRIAGKSSYTLIGDGGIEAYALIDQAEAGDLSKISIYLINPSAQRIRISDLQISGTGALQQNPIIYTQTTWTQNIGFVAPYMIDRIWSGSAIVGKDERLIVSLTLRAERR